MRLRSKAYLAALAAGVAIASGAASGPALGDASSADRTAPTAAAAQSGDDRDGRQSPQCRAALRRLDYFQNRVAADRAYVAKAKRRLAAARRAKRNATSKQARSRAAKRVAKRRKELREARVTLRNTKSQLRSATAQAEAQGCLS